MKWIIITFSLINLMSCVSSQNEKGSSGLRVLDIIPGESSSLNLSEIAESISYIQLETNENCLIGSAYNFSLFKDKIYVLDAMNARILCFNDNGEYLFKIDRKGNGPGEYNHLSDFSIDKDDELLLIYDRMSMEVLEFNLSGEFLESNYVGVQLSEIGIIDSESYYFYNYDGPDPSFVLQRVNKKDGKLMSEHILQNKNTDFLRHSSFNQDNTSLTLCYAYNDTIYNIGTNGEVKPYFLVNFPQKVDLIKKLSNIPYHDRDGQRQIRNNGAWGNVGYHRTSSNYLYFYYVNYSEIHQVFFSLETGKHFHFNKMYNDIDGMPLSSRPIFLTDKSIMFKVDPMRILEELGKGENSNLEEVLVDLKPIIEDSNPLIAILTIEKF